MSYHLLRRVRRLCSSCPSPGAKRISSAVIERNCVSGSLPLSQVIGFTRWNYHPHNYLLHPYYNFSHNYYTNFDKSIHAGGVQSELSSEKYIIVIVSLMFAIYDEQLLNLFLLNPVLSYARLRKELILL